MSYAITMNAEDVNCKIPLCDIPKLQKEYEEVKFCKNNQIELIFDWEEDGGCITGKIIENEIILDSEQHGIFRRSSDGGLSSLLEDYKGDGMITECGEEGDGSDVTKYVKGVKKKGRIVFDD